MKRLTYPKNLKSLLITILSIFVITSGIYIFGFMTTKLLLQGEQLTEDFDDENYYHFFDNERTRKDVDDYFPNKDEIAYYTLDSVELGDEYYLCEIMSYKAMEKGLLIFSELGQCTFANFKDVDLKTETLITNDKNLSIKYGLTYLDYVTTLTIFSPNGNFLYNAPIIKFSESINISNCAGAIFPFKPSFINSYSHFDDLGIVGTGKELKASYKWESSTLDIANMFLSITPIVFMLVSLCVLINQYIRNQQDYIYIKYIFYKGKLRLINSLFWETFLITFLASLGSATLTFLIFNASFNSYITILILTLIAFLLIEPILAAYNVNRLIRKKVD